MDLKKRLKKHKLILLAVSLVFLAIAAAFTFLAVMNTANLQTLFILLCVLFYFAFLITILMLPCAKYILTTINGHRVEVYLGGKTYLLVSDGVILDKYEALIVMALKLEGMVNGKHIVVRVTPGVFAPVVAIYVDGVRHATA